MCGNCLLFFSPSTSGLAPLFSIFLFIFNIILHFIFTLYFFYRLYLLLVAIALPYKISLFHFICHFNSRRMPTIPNTTLSKKQFHPLLCWEPRTSQQHPRIFCSAALRGTGLRRRQRFVGCELVCQCARVKAPNPYVPTGGGRGGGRTDGTDRPPPSPGGRSQPNFPASQAKFFNTAILKCLVFLLMLFAPSKPMISPRQCLKLVLTLSSET